MTQSRVRARLAWLLLGVLAFFYGMAAVAKLTGQMDHAFTEWWGYPAWLATVIGGVELLGAIGLLVPKATRWAVYGLSLVMLGAIYTHVAAGEGMQVMRPIAFVAVLWTALFLRRRASEV